MDLKQLTELNAVSGHEQALRRLLLEELKALDVAVSIDRMGNVVALKKGTAPDGQRKRVMISAHMDEVGLLVNGHTEEGFLRVVQAGGVDPRVIISKRVLVGDEKIPGIIGAKAIHLQSPADRERVLGYDDIYVDIGAKDKAEAMAKAPLCTYIAFDTPYVEYGEGFACAKALDDRVGIYNLFRVLEDSYPHDVIAVFASQEEVGCRGGKGAAFAQNPDIGLVLEGTTCADMGKTPETSQVCKCGEGVAVSFMDLASIGNRALFKLALRLGDEQKITYQVKASVTGGNEGGVIQRTR